MANFTFKMRLKENNISKFTDQTTKAVKKAVKDCGQDLARTSSETAPHLTGDLEDSYSIAYSGGMRTPKATVEFAVYKGGFNYAVAMHEWSYKLGEGSTAKGGGTGMSGTTYPVGNKYLTRVLEGEKQAYYDHIKQQIENNLGG